MKKPYQKKLAQAGKFTVWSVDGSYIWKKINEEFTNFGQHFRFPFIPKNEFWIDHECCRGEEGFYIDHMMIEHQLMARGKSYEDAIEIADRTEKKERQKSTLAQTLSREGKQEVLAAIHKRKIKKYSDVLDVYVVNGEAVRDLYWIDFTEGGHDKVYHFVPGNEIWLDDDLTPAERKFVLLHEVHERNLMAKGWQYHSAHYSSSQLEYFCRHHPAKLDAKLALEFKNAVRE